LLGVGFGATMSSLSKLVTVYFNQEMRGLDTGIYVRDFSIGCMFAYALTPYIVECTRSWRHAFSIQGGGALVLAVLW